MSRLESAEQAQNYLARIRYKNELLAPQCPPKMLAMPNSAVDTLCDVNFTSRLARTDSINVDVDGELGMPLDMSHLPGVFDGNDSAIRPIEPYPSMDPRDRLLLRSASQLGNLNIRAAAAAGPASFLRRTEYISAEQSKSTFKSKSTAIFKSSQVLEASRARRTAGRAKEEDPIRILRAILHGFEVANPDTATGPKDLCLGDEVAAEAERNWKEMRHPGKPHLQPVESFPLLPDVAASSDCTGFMVFKFATDPIINDSKQRDTRLDAGLLRPHDAPSALEQVFDYYIPATNAVSSDIKYKLASYNGHDPNPKQEFMYEFVRAYKTKAHKEHNPDVIEEAALVFHDGDFEKNRGAYYYPVLVRYTLMPHRTSKFLAGMPGGQMGETEEEPPEVLNVKVRDLNYEERRRRGVYSRR